MKVFKKAFDSVVSPPWAICDAPEGQLYNIKTRCGVAAAIMFPIGVGALIAATVCYGRSKSAAGVMAGRFASKFYTEEVANG